LRALALSSNGDSVLSDLAYLNNRFGRLRDIAVGPNQEIYLATNGASWANTDPYTHLIVRIQPPTQPPAGTWNSDVTGSGRNPHPSWVFYPQPLQGNYLYFRPLEHQLALGAESADLLPSQIDFFDELGRMLATVPVETSDDQASYRLRLPENMHKQGARIVARILNNRGAILSQNVLFR